MTQIQFLIVFCFILWWAAVYTVSANIKSRVAWLICALLFCIIFYIVCDIYTRPLPESIILSPVFININKLSTLSYIISIGLLYFLCAQITQTNNKLMKVVMFALTCIFCLLATFTNSITDYKHYIYTDTIGAFSYRGCLFWALTPFVLLSTISSFLYTLRKLKMIKVAKDKIKYKLLLLTMGMYTLVGPILVIGYLILDKTLITQLTPYLLSIPMIPILISIFFYGLINSVEPIFNFKEFAYLTFVNILIIALYSAIISIVNIYVRIDVLFISTLLAFVTIFTHSFYGWLKSIIKDLVYGSGTVSQITDDDLDDLIKNYHNPEKLETNQLLKFAKVKNDADGKLRVDSAQKLVKEAIEYFKQADYPRRTKMNLKYQILKMMIIDGCEEGQILWELGFEGYPMKIFSGERQSRPPIFKIESMSDYTAISRNAFIILKKEAVHDLGWRLSYLEKSVK